MRDAADQRLDILDRYLARQYADAIAVLLRNEQYSSEEMRELELQIARTSDLVREYDAAGRRRGGYVLDLGDRFD